MKEGILTVILLTGLGLFTPAMADDAGGGMPPDVSTENIRTFITTVRNYS